MNILDRSLLFTLSFLLLSAGCSKIQPKVSQSGSEKEHGGFYPYELFYIDKNYPATTLHQQTFQQRMQLQIRKDQTAERSLRGLDFTWTVQGPGNIGGRVNTIAVDPFDPEHVLLGYSQGGIYMSEDHAQNWKPVFDEQLSLSVSHISFDPHQEGKLYATTGDVNISGYPFLGSGVYRSDDGGHTWQNIGLEDKGILSKVFADPFNNNIVYVGSMGYPSQKGAEKGLFRSTDGGESWNQTLFIDDSTGIIDMALDMTRPGRVYATGWTRLRTGTYSTTVGPGTSVYVSNDYGETWDNLIQGLPGHLHSRTGVETTLDGTVFISYVGQPTEGDCAGNKESLLAIYRSFDGGNIWEQVPMSTETGFNCDVLAGFGWYFEVLKVTPHNPNDIYVLGVDLYRTVDGGNFWFEFANPWWTYTVHADKHDLAFVGDYMYLATDGGAYYGWQNGAPDTWVDIENIPSTQFYRTVYNPHQPEHYFGGAQDNGTTGGNVNNMNMWPRIFGGDGFQPLFDPGEPGWIYCTTQNGSIWFSQDTAQEFNHLNDGLYNSRYWDMPFIMSPHHPKILFCASDRVFRINMQDSVREWFPISGDLTRGDTILGNRYPAVTALAQSAIDELRIYAGTQDGKLWTTADGGENWTDITEGTPGYYVTSITTSTIDPLTVFVTYSGYRDNDHTPYIYRSIDAGDNWVSLSENVPVVGVNSFMILPGSNDEILFAGTDGGVYVSLNGGILWDRLGTNFPYMPVYDLEYNPVMNTIVAATFSRGIMTFPVEELDLASAVDPPDLAHNEITVYPTVAEDQVYINFGKTHRNTNGMEIIIVSSDGTIVYQSKTEVKPIVEICLDDNITSGYYLVMTSTGRNRELAGSFIKL